MRALSWPVKVSASSSTAGMRIGQQPLRRKSVRLSATSFFRHFRAVISLTPIQYQKQIRLQEARAKLLASPGDVAAVGYAVGYDSPSQFSREYRRLFGAPPGRDTARLQETSLSASPV
jgi:transcriptional regulator GlxA family with amidase domain